MLWFAFFIVPWGNYNVCMDNSGCLISSTFSIVVFCILYCLKEKNRKYLHEIFNMLYFPFFLRLYCEYFIASWRNGNISMVYSGCRLLFFSFSFFLSYIFVFYILDCPMGKWTFPWIIQVALFPPFFPLW